MNFTTVGTVFIVLAILPLKIDFCYVEKNDPERIIWYCQIFSFKQKCNTEPFTCTKVTISLKNMRFFCFQVYKSQVLICILGMLNSYS